MIFINKIIPMKDSNHLNKIQILALTHERHLFFKKQLNNKKMKKLLKLISIAILLSCFASVKAQVNFDMGAGYSTDKNFTAQIGLNYEVSNLCIGGEIRPSITRKIESMQLFGFRGGYNVLNEETAIIPFIGYYYNKFSDSKLTKGEWITGYGIRAYKMVNDDAAVYIEPCYLKNNAQVNFGIIYKFN